MRGVLTAVVLTVALVSSEQVHAEEMSGKEIKMLLADGITLKLGGPSMGYTGSVRLEPDGTGTGSVKTDRGKKLDITGTWTIEGDQFCRKWAFDNYVKTCEIWRISGEKKVDVIVGGKKIGINSW